MKISLLHPSRGRPHKSLETCKKWIDRAGYDDIELIVSLDNSDNHDGYKNLFSRTGFVNENTPERKIIVNINRSAVDAVNHAAKASIGTILVVVSDDSDCPNGWALKILEATNGKRDFVLKTFDGVQKWIVTMPIVGREYYDRFGYIYHPDYLHMFVDTDFTHVADVLKKIIWRNDILFPHLHYSVTRLRRDDTSIKADDTWHQGKNLYLRRFNERFGLAGHVNIWDISNQGHRTWLQEALRR
jgi:hypothetical protein